MEPLPTSIILAAFGFAAIAAMLMAALKGWQDWLALKRLELTPRSGPGGEERGEIAELRARVKQLEAIAACVDL
jgi:hypothetical protein